MNKVKKAAIHNLGCKVNAYEAEAMQQMLEDDGYQIVPFAPGADVYIINTCTVTNIADRKSRQMLHRAKKMNPEAIVVAAGCYVQASKESLEEDSEIDIIIGNDKKKDLVSILENYKQYGTVAAQVLDISSSKEFENLALNRTQDHTRAYIKIQDGCNQFCSYCIIPYARGRVRSRRSADIIEEVIRLADQGYQEVVLTGIHLSSYGIDFENEEENALLRLIKAVHSVEGISRIRLGSLEPRIITEDFVRELSTMSKFCPHFHLSLQSGSDQTLLRMNRRYNTREYYEKCVLIRRYFEHPALTTDIIVGFPGETREEFEDTKAFVQKVRFFEIHIFKYSKRKGTKAALMQNQVQETEKGIRSKELSILQEEYTNAYAEHFLGKKAEILFEEKKIINSIEYYIGHTKEYLKAAVQSKENLINKKMTAVCREISTDHVIMCALSKD